MKKIIYQYSCPGTNVGDNALTIGLINSFKNFNVQIHNLHLRKIKFTPQYIDKINKECHMIIIGGGGLLHCSPGVRKKKNNTSGTLWNISPHNISLINVPLVIYAVGYNVFRGEKDLPPIAKQSINIMIQKASFFSVRNDGSIDRLNKFLGNKNKNIFKIPDPGLYVHTLDKPIKNVSVDPNKINIAFQLAFDRIDYRYPNLNDFIAKLKCLIDKLILNNIIVWFVPHVKLDHIYIHKFFNPNKYNLLPYLPKYQKCTTVMNFYSKMNIVVGMRGHSNICPFGLNIPIISLVTHEKNKGFMIDCGLKNMFVDINMPKWINNLENIINHIIKNQKFIKSKIINKNKEYYNQTLKINKLIINKIK